MNRKGQITIFIIIAIILIIAAGAYIYFTSKPVMPEEIQRLIVDVPELGKPIAAYIYSCMDLGAPVGILTIARGGGYVFPPTALKTEYGTLGYGYRLGDDILASKEEIEAQISHYMGTVVLSCFDISLFEKQGYKIELEEITTETQMLPDKLIVTMNIPMTVSKGDASIQLNDFALAVEIPLGRLHAIAKTFIAQLKENPDEISLSFMQGIPEEIEILPIDSNNIAVAVRDPQTVLNDEPLTFLFAAEVAQNLAPEFKNLPDTMEYTEGETVSFTVEAEDPEGNAFVFSADPILFEINQETGAFAFTPEIPDTYLIEFTVIDDKGNTNRKNVEIIINPR